MHTRMPCSAPTCAFSPALSAQQCPYQQLGRALCSAGLKPCTNCSHVVSRPGSHSPVRMQRTSNALLRRQVAASPNDPPARQTPGCAGASRFQDAMESQLNVAQRMSTITSALDKVRLLAHPYLRHSWAPDRVMKMWRLPPSALYDGYLASDRSPGRLSGSAPHGWTVARCIAPAVKAGSPPARRKYQSEHSCNNRIGSQHVIESCD